MDPITLAIAAINGMSLVLNNPALGGGSSLRFDQASEILGLLGTLLNDESESASEDLKALTSMIEDMAENGRGPTRTELATLHALAQDAPEEESLEEDTPPEPTPETEPEAEAETGSDPEGEPEANENPGAV
jgi:hypothetical protein